MLVAMFLKKLYVDHNSRAATLTGYADSIDQLHLLRKMNPPANLSSKSTPSFTVIENLKKEEDVARQRLPLDILIFAKLKELAEGTHEDSFERAIFNWICLGRFGGYRGGEFLQKTQDRVEYHTYPSKKRVVKAFVPKDWIFTDSDGKIIEELTEAHLDCLQSTEVTHRLQKNRRNNQKLNFSADNNNKDLCFCRNAAQIVLRAKRLGQSDDLPLAIYKNSKQSSFKYLTSRKVTEYLRKATRLAHPDWPKEKVNMIGIHSIRVFALVLLSEANKPSWFMKARLRWVSDSYKLYLRDTSAISNEHTACLDSSSSAAIALISSNLNNLPSDTPIDDEMGAYNDID